MPVLSLDGREIHFREEGAGAPLVLLHCSSSHSGQWKPWMRDVARHAHVMAPDLHGYGRSADLPAAAIWWEADRLLVPALAERVGRKVHVVGHSLGAATAVYSAVSHGHSVASLTLIEPVLFGLLHEAGMSDYSDAEMISESLWHLLSEGKDERAALEFTDFWSGAGSFARLTSQQRDYIVATIHRVGRDWEGIRPSVAGQLTLRDIEALALPVHLLKGGRSRLSGQRIVDLLHERLPRSDLTVIPDADHLGAVTRPDLFLPAVLAWLMPKLAA